jgi:hypothetical protein
MIMKIFEYGDGLGVMSQLKKVLKIILKKYLKESK